MLVARKQQGSIVTQRNAVHREVETVGAGGVCLLCERGFHKF